MLLATLRPDDWIGLLCRLALALLVGGVIGWNREQSGKAAGLRTHMLVSLGSALFVLIPLQTTILQTPDALSRVIQGVATGVGFLGAGEILHRPKDGKLRAKGLTSAAAIWVAAALGMVAGCGLWQLSLVGTAMTTLVLSGVKYLERRRYSHEDGDNNV
ncbi:protein SrpB [Neosynechococcus sphagnicola sy1]|uniref:Protein SrpB n=1 Tax=Neosynechococcus sphagnicola sy1 TaxID=1497020 RepID=A0A098TM82_9CYAN|nr:MgtC/SapB family protein [Neosynechococcus sphagnicola]KGF71948.1 protein SrpB [Neosynechococcus sphagnicola sy1]